MVEGKRVELSQIIAYEFVSQGQWRTRVLATETAINQNALVDMLKTTASDEGWDVSPPFLKLELDEKDRLTSISLNAEKVPGGAVRSEMEGDALVEAGRVRGTVKVTPKKFFEKSYSAEMTFDVPLITSESTPEKRLANAPKLPSTGKLTLAGKAHSLPNVTVYETQQFDQVLTVVLFTEQPINLPKLKASLNKPTRNDDDFIEFQTQVKLLFNSKEKLQSMSIWCDNLSVSATGSDNVKASIVIEEGRARGTVKTTQPGEAVGKAYDFDVSFDATVLALPAAK
jgi:hypothetical protein